MKRRSDDERRKNESIEEKDSSSTSDDDDNSDGSDSSSITSESSHVRRSGRAENVPVAAAQHENESDSSEERKIRSPTKRRRTSNVFESKAQEARRSSPIEQHQPSTSVHRVGDTSISRQHHPVDLLATETRRENASLQQLYELLQEHEFSALSRMALHQQAQQQSSAFSLGLQYGGLPLQSTALSSILESSNPIYQRLGVPPPPQPPSLLDLLGRRTVDPHWPYSALQDPAVAGLSALTDASRRLTPFEMALANQTEQINPYAAAAAMFPNISTPQQTRLENLLLLQEQQRQQLINRAIASDPMLGLAGIPGAVRPVTAAAVAAATVAGDPLSQPAPPPQQRPHRSSPVTAAAARRSTQHHPQPPPSSAEDLFIPALRRQFPGGFVSDPRSVILAIPDDRAKLNSQQVFLRHQIEVFRASHDDILSHTRGRNKPVMLGQVGIRCRHCGHLPVAQRSKGSTYFPSSVKGIYQASQNLSVTHLQSGNCAEMPREMKQQFAGLMSSKVASSGVGRPYWAEAAGKLGLVDTPYGIRFSDDVPPGGLQLDDEGVDDEEKEEGVSDTDDAAGSAAAPSPRGKKSRRR